MKKKYVFFILFFLLIITWSFMGPHLNAYAEDKNNMFYEVNNDDDWYIISFYTSQGVPLVEGDVQIFSRDDNENVFIGKTDKNGKIKVNFKNDKKIYNTLINSRYGTIIDKHYTIIAGNKDEFLFEGITISFTIDENRKLLKRDTNIKQNYTTLDKTNKSNTSTQNKNILDSVSIQSYEDPRWRLVSTRDLGIKETTVIRTYACNGVSTEAWIRYGSSYGSSITLSGPAVITTSFSITSDYEGHSALRNWTSPSKIEYKTNIRYKEEYWVDAYYGGEKKILVPTKLEGGLNCYSYYEPYCSSAYLGTAISYNNKVQAGYEEKISYTFGKTVSAAATISSTLFTNLSYSVDAYYKSSYESTLFRKYSNIYNWYYRWPTGDGYVVHE